MTCAAPAAVSGCAWLIVRDDGVDCGRFRFDSARWQAGYEGRNDVAWSYATGWEPGPNPLDFAYLNVTFTRGRVSEVSAPRL